MAMVDGADSIGHFELQIKHELPSKSDFYFVMLSSEIKSQIVIPKTMFHFRFYFRLGKEVETSTKELDKNVLSSGARVQPPPLEACATQKNDSVEYVFHEFPVAVSLRTRL